MRNDTIEVGDFWRHKESGNVYRVTGFCMLEKSFDLAVLYIEETAIDESLPWARDKQEFLDGRFEKIGKD